MTETNKLIDALETDGFVVVRDFFDPETVRKAREEIEHWYMADEDERRKQRIDSPKHSGVAGTTILTNPTHLMIDVYGKSPTLDGLFEQILGDERSSAILSALAGRNIKLRGYNIKKMTGKSDPKPTLGPSAIPHEWHRDSPFEICVAIFLDDFSEPSNGTTALLKGSHVFPYCPRWNCLFGPILPMSRYFKLQLGFRWFLKFNVFSRLLARRIRGLETGAYGKRGDFYIFINDVWHGREPNIHGNDHMMLMVGAFPVEAAFPDVVAPPSQESLAKLPPRLRAAAAQALAPNAGEQDTILKRLERHRARHRTQPLFLLAKLERGIAELLSAPYLWLRSLRRKPNPR